MAEAGIAVRMTVPKGYAGGYRAAMQSRSPQNAPIERGTPIARLIVTPDRITIVDFKSNTVVPKSADQVPEGILRQMGAYVAALRQVYPGRSVQPFILWTRSAQLMPLAPDIVSAALDRAAIP